MKMEKMKLNYTFHSQYFNYAFCTNNSDHNHTKTMLFARSTHNMKFKLLYKGMRKNAIKRLAKNKKALAMTKNFFKEELYTGYCR